MNLLSVLSVGFGGFCGAILRYSCGFLPIPHRADFPFITLGINFIGAFLIGWISAYAAKHTGVNPQMILFLKVGLCGGFTTFSTFSLECIQLLDSGRIMSGGIYIFCSVILCLLAVILGKSLV